MQQNVKERRGKVSKTLTGKIFKHRNMDSLLKVIRHQVVQMERSKKLLFRIEGMWLTHVVPINSRKTQAFESGILDTLTLDAEEFSKYWKEQKNVYNSKGEKL